MIKQVFTFLIGTLILVSCRKVDKPYFTDGKEYECNCPDITFSEIEKKWGSHYVNVKMKNSSTRAPINYPGVKLIDQNKNEINISYSYYMDKGYDIDFDLNIPDSLIVNCNWTIELVQLHSEDSVICSKKYNQCLN